MYLIKNVTTRDVVLDDLRVILAAGGQIDLDKVAARHLIEASPKLRMARQQKRIVLLNVDGEKVQVINGPDPDALREMEERLKADFAKQLAAVVAAQSKQTEVTVTPPSNDLTALTATIAQLVEKVAESNNRPVVVTPAYTQTGESAPAQPLIDRSTSDGISDDIAGRMHAKAMKRVEKGVKGYVETEGKKSRDDDLMNNMDELERLS